MKCRKRTKFILLSILIIICWIFNLQYKWISFHPFKGGGKADFRVLTWNIHNSGKDFDARQPGITQLILDEDADIVLLNEFCLRKSPVMDSTLRLRYPYVVDNWAKPFSGDIFYSKYPIKRFRRINNDTLWPLAYEFRLEINERDIRIVGCHLLSTNNLSKQRYTLKKWKDLSTLPTYYNIYKEGKAMRTAETELIMSRIQKDTLPTLIMGDMNDMSGMAPLNRIEKNGFQDAWWKGGTGCGITFVEGWMRFRLDHIMYNSSFTLIDINVIDTPLSDHRPLIGSFKLNSEDS